MTQGIAVRTSDRGARRGWRFISLAGLLGVAATLGCGSKTVVNPPNDKSNLRGIIQVYGMAARDLGRPPKNMDELKAVYAPVDPNPDKLVRSPRDGEEFAVVWGLNLEGLPAVTVLAYERRGVDGKRMVVTLDGMVHEVTSEELVKMKFPKNYKPES